MTEQQATELIALAQSIRIIAWIILLMVGFLIGKNLASK